MIVWLLAIQLCAAGNDCTLISAPGLVFDTHEACAIALRRRPRENWTCVSSQVFAESDMKKIETKQ